MPASYSRASVAGPMPFRSRKLASDWLIFDLPRAEISARSGRVLDLNDRALVEPRHVEARAAKCAVEEHRDHQLVDPANVAARVALVQRVWRNVERDGVVRDRRVSRHGVVAGEEDLRATADGLGKQMDVPVAAKGSQPERPEQAVDFPRHVDLEWVVAVQNVVAHLEARERHGG